MSSLRIRRELKSGHLVPSGDMWPRFLFRSYEYSAADPWDGLLRSSLLVKVCDARAFFSLDSSAEYLPQAFKHVFTSPSSVYQGDGTSKSTKSSNARIHGMASVTIPSLAYIATQVSVARSVRLELHRQLISHCIAHTGSLCAGLWDDVLPH